jgi:uncharacterized protein YkwD
MEVPARVGRASLRALLIAVLALVALPAAPAAAGTPCSGADARPTSRSVEEARDATACLINRERTRRGLRALRTNGSLQSSASSYARDMVRRSFFAHVSPSGETLTERIRRQTSYLSGALSWEIGENLAWGTGSKATPSQIVAGWMRSPGHRRNILHGGYREMGLGIAIGTPADASAASGGATYANHFGRRG